MPTQEELSDTFVVISSDEEDNPNKGFFGKFKNTFRNITEGS